VRVDLIDAIELLDIAEAARFLNVSETSLRRWTNGGLLPCLRIGRRRERRFRRADLLAFMEHQPGQQHDGKEKGRSTSADILNDEPVASIHGNHLCGIYGSDAGRLSLVVPFLLQGLREKSVCFLIAPSRAQREILKAMERKRPSLPSEIKAGRLIVSEHQKSPADQVRFLENRMAYAEAAGVESFRLFGDMWGLRQLVSARQMVELELGFERLLVARYPLVAICAYDARRFSGLELLDALRDHEDTRRVPLAATLAR
jgi:transcriptional repressor of dcmA and dcmR